MRKIKSILKFKSVDYSVDSVTNNSIFLNTPFDFNDPLDSYFIQLFGEKYKNTPKSIKEYIDIGKEIGIFCGTTVENLYNVLLWSHYADSHRGIVLKYNVPENFSGKLDAVEYGFHSHEEFMKSINYGNPLNLPETTLVEKEEKIMNSLFLKDSEWNYENEIRYVKKMNDNEPSFDYNWKIDRVYIGSEYLRNSNQILEELIQLIDLCMEKKIEMTLMEYRYDKSIKRMKLEESEWKYNEVMREEEKWLRIRRKVIDELFIRFSRRNEGTFLKKYIEEISKNTFDKEFKK